MTSSTGSGMTARVEHLDDGLERVLAILDRLYERVGDLRVEMAAVRGDIANVRALVDGVHERAEKLETAYGALVLRVNTLEERLSETRAAQPHRPIALSAGVAAGAGGVVAGLAEAIKAILAAT